jgi:hypothetical protein
MMIRRPLEMEKRPSYYYGQLLLAEDFLAEQSYHVDARRRHNLNLHGWGVVWGLEVERAGGASLRLRPGFAIDREGHEILIEKAEVLDLGDFPGGVTVELSLSYEERGEKQDKRHECSAVVTVSEPSPENTGVHLAAVRLDDDGQVQADAIDYSATRFLRRGWVRMPFRPAPLANIPEGEHEIPPPFRVGATEALSPRPSKNGEEDRGAAGTMPLLIPSNAREVTGFRIAGERNEGEISFSLVVGGWDPESDKHVRRDVLREVIPAGSPYRRDYPFTGVHLDPGFSTLSLWLRASRRAAVSLVAVEFSY